MSTQTRGMCAHHVLDDVVTAALADVKLRPAFRRCLAFLLANVRRSNLDRDARSGRLRAGLRLALAP